MVVKKSIQRVGNSAGIILSQDVLAESGFSRDDEVVIRSEKGRITITRLDPDFDAMVLAADRFVSKYPNAFKKLAE